jgi:RNA polymerase sigma-70 factor (ECF subfamily)
VVPEFEPDIRRLIRVRLTDPTQQRVLDCDNVLQSVLGNFFVRVIAGRFDLDETVQLVKLPEAATSLPCGSRATSPLLRLE